MAQIKKNTPKLTQHNIPSGPARTLINLSDEYVQVKTAVCNGNFKL